MTFLNWSECPKLISALAIEMAAFFVRAYAQKSYNG